ncbi:MAG TPA: exopolysaccharide biosynthesis protein [Thermoanaerobaculia bacterium]|nr:exopolysaccharide biosynthesis protein [Thermoanaerobaculia bacterium]
MEPRESEWSTADLAPAAAEPTTLDEEISHADGEEPDSAEQTGQDEQTGGDEQDEPDGLDDVLDRIEGCAEDSERVSIGNVVDAVGSHSFGPLILFVGLLLVVPGVGDIPGVPVMGGLFVILVTVQHLMGRDHVWIPGWLTRRSVRAKLVEKTVKWSRKPARFIDRWTHRRLTWAVRQTGFVVIAVSCLLISAATPLMEVVPFSAALAGIVLTAFGIALLVCDGLVALIAMVLAIGTGVLIGWQLI